ncbi:MAG: GNAT family N-acetyltransferase [Roseiarcus sp.]
MSLFGLARIVEPEPRLEGRGLYLRPAAGIDFSAWASLRAESRAFLTRWEPTWPADDLTRSSFRRRVRRQNLEISRDEAYPFLIFDAATDVILGGVTLGGVRRGVAQTATLGYWMGARHAGKGVMTRAVGVVSRWGFQHLRLHRIEAACLPENAASRALLERNGFQYEGCARQYLRINGEWRDHMLFALLEHEASRLV